MPMPTVTGRAAAFLGAVLLASALTACAGQAARPADTAAPGRIAVTNPTVDLGNVPFKDQKEARFELTNTGGKVVRIVDQPETKLLQGC